MQFVSRVVSSCAVLALLVSGALAGDPAAPDFDKSLARCRELVLAEKFAEGETALRRLFADFANDPRVRAHLHEIEDDLKLCLFRKGMPALKPADLFGNAARKFVPSTREVEFHSSSLDAPLWEITEEGTAVLTARLEGSVTVTIHSSLITPDDKAVVVFLCYDVEKRGGYAVVPGFRDETTYSETEIAKVSPAGRKPLTLRMGTGTCTSRGGAVIVRNAGEILVKTGGGEVVARTSDNTYTNGYVALAGGSAASVSIKGKLELSAYKKRVAEHFAAEFAQWQEKSWDRTKEVPAWASELALATPDMTLSELPSDGPHDERAELVAMVESAAAGDVESALLAQAVAGQMPTRTALYFAGVAALTLDSYKAAGETFDQLVALEPDFVPARLFRALARFHVRRIDEAKADVAWVIDRKPRCVMAHVTAAWISIYEQDLAGAARTLARAAESGVTDEEIAEVRGWIHRARRGPNLTQRFEHTTERFVVVSDHSKKICIDVGTLLESMQAQYAAALRQAPKSATKARVYVFSGPQGYMDYAADLHVRADSSAGVYLPMLRELVIWIPVDKTDFLDTVRHEGFHQYLHRLADDAPFWFNEGYAEVMGGGGPEGLRNKDRDGEWVKEFMPVRELVALPPDEFMEDAGICYTQSRYLIDFLRRTKHEKLKNLLRDYFAAVAEGLSQTEANAKVLDPVMDLLEAEFTKGL